MLRSSLMEADEGSMYTKDDADLTHEGILELIDFLDKNKNLLTVKANNILDVMVIEINRFYYTYGINDSDVKIRALIIALGLVEDYIRKDAFDQSKFESNVNLVMFPLLDKIIEYSSRIKDIELKSIDGLLWKMIALWRDLFLKFGEPGLLMAPGEERTQQYMKKGEAQITFPPGTKDKLTDLLSKSIEDKLRKEMRT
jgi:uncharacterized protein (DUF2164 family)